MQAAISDPNAEAAQFRCDNCGGELLYEPTTRGMRCRHCKAQGNAALLQGSGPGPREIPLAAGVAMQARTGLGVATQAVECKSCGATVQMAPNERAGKCTYCASPMVVAVAAGSQLSPESLIPFLVGKDAATTGFKLWLSRLWFRPSDLGKLAKLEEIFGVYVPYWTFDADVHSEWTAERGWNYQETEYYTDAQGNSQTRTVTKTRWESAWGSRHDHHDDVLVCGSKGMPKKLVDQLTSFSTRTLVPYAPAYLAGWRAESYAVALPAAWTIAQGKIAVDQEKACGRDVGGDTHRGLSVTNHFSRETFKHILLPVYVAAYRYQNKPYQVLVNGQTGDVVGTAPYSFWKIFGLIVGIIALIAAIIFGYNLSQQKPSSSGGAPTTAKPTAAPKPAPTALPPKKK